MSIRKNVVNNFVLQFVSLLMPLVTLPYVTRTLNKKDFGRITFVDAFIQYFIIFAMLGVPFYGLREIAKVKDDIERRCQITKELVVLNFSLAILCMLLFLSVSFFIPVLKSDFNLVIIGCMTLLSYSFMIEWYFQGVENFSFITKRGIFFKLAYTISIFLFVKSESDYVLYYLLTCLLIFGNALVNFLFFLKSNSISSFSVYPKSLLIHIKPLMVLFSINVSVSVYTILDTIILGLFKSPVHVANYAIALRFVKVYWTLMAAIGIVLMPKVSAMFSQGDHSGVVDVLSKSRDVVYLLSIPFGFFCFIFPNEVLNFLFGPQYNATDVLRVLAFAPVIIGICNVFGTQFLLPIGKEKHILRATIYGLVVSLGFNFVLDPIIGDVGASIACIVAESTVCIYIVVKAQRYVRLNFNLKLICEIILCLFVSTLFGYLLGAQFGLNKLILSVLLYAVVFLFSSVFVFKNRIIISIIYFNR
ncbi:MAG TPA: flippase [Phnomibacter sp.]|nr:flippase [Phnomibacter sp.]